MKRIAFVGAAAAWASVQCTDDVLPGLLDATSDFGWTRIMGNELPKSLALIEAAKGDSLNSQTTQAQSLIRSAVEREIGALRSIETIHTGSDAAIAMLANKVTLWQGYGASLNDLVVNTAKLRAKQLNVPEPQK